MLRRLLLTMLVLTLSCGSPPSRTDVPARVDPRPGGPLASDSGRVEEERTARLLYAGKGPRRQLRYHFQAATSQTFEVDVSISARITANAALQPVRDVPPVRFAIRLEVTKVEGDGAAQIAMSIERAEVLRAPGDSPLVHFAEKDAARFVGMRGAGVVTARGIAPERVDLTMPQGVATDFRRHDRVLGAFLEFLFLPLPEEAVGVNATWETVKSFDVEGARARRSDRYTLMEVDDRTAVAISSTTVAADPRQLLKTEDPELTRTLMAFDWRVDREFHVALDGGLATEGMAMIVESTAFELARSDRARAVTTDAKTRLSFRRVSRPSKP
ncbi:MAG: hypothetical protein JST00_26265 [Deltaproteobacteria bacterium]|nr:hypothetical protein [Deltaproteobacteria bacterium]